MKTNRPKIDLSLEPIDIIVDLISATLLILMVVYTIMVYSDLPQTIATHFNANGEADSFGDKITLWILPAIGVAIFTGVFFINKYPHIHNYKINITEDNALKNYRLSTRVVRFTNLFCQIIFAIIIFEIIQLAKGNEVNLLGIPFLIITILLPLIGV
ncbi:MAG: DUF1648 domain-containing protein, partial [Flavobacteriaceae bacterium]|nr:DUF1648 domain-containing protein [Flavobacteriaceae bacterium]